MMRQWHNLQQIWDKSQRGLALSMTISQRSTTTISTVVSDMYPCYKMIDSLCQTTWSSTWSCWSAPGDYQNKGHLLSSRWQVVTAARFLQEWWLRKDLCSLAFSIPTKGLNKNIQHVWNMHQTALQWGKQAVRRRCLWHLPHSSDSYTHLTFFPVLSLPEILLFTILPIKVPFRCNKRFVHFTAVSLSVKFSCWMKLSAQA